MFNFDTYKIANDRTITDCQIEVNSGNYYPQVRLNPTAEEERAYRMLIEYSNGFNNRYGSPLIDIHNFKKLFGILYFDLSGRVDGLRDENVKLEFRFTLNGTPNAYYNIYALILHQHTVSVDVTSGKDILRT